MPAGRISASLKNKSNDIVFHNARVILQDKVSIVALPIIGALWKLKAPPHRSLWYCYMV